MTELSPALDQRLRESKLAKDPLAFVPLAGVQIVPLAHLWASSYELGRADRLRIPAGMVRVELRTLVGPFAWLMLMLFLALSALHQMQQLGMPRTLRTIAQRLRGAFSLVQVAAGANLVWQRDSPPTLVLPSLATIYALLYGIPSLLGVGLATPAAAQATPVVASPRPAGAGRGAAPPPWGALGTAVAAVPACDGSRSPWCSCRTRWAASAR